MNLFQSMLALGALILLGVLTLNTNRAILTHDDDMNVDESRITAMALAQSLAEEAGAKYFDAQPEDQPPGVLNNTSDLTPVNALGHGATEHYRGGAHDFNDFDDFNNLFVVYKSSNPADTASTPGSDYESIIPGLKAKYYLKAKVEYVKVDGSNIPIADQTSGVPTWHKRITVTVIDITRRDTVVYPAIMSYWN